MLMLCLRRCVINKRKFKNITCFFLNIWKNNLTSQHAKKTVVMKKNIHHYFYFFRNHFNGL